MDENQDYCKNLYVYYQFLLRNLERDIKAMNNLIHSPKLLQKRKFRKPKKTDFMEIIKKGEYKIGELTEKENEEIDAITKHASLNDLMYKFYKIGIIIAYVYFEAFNKDMMRVFDNTSNYERYNILSNLGRKNEDLKKLNDTLMINVEVQYSNWKSLIEGYILRNMIVHNNGRFDKKTINKLFNLKALDLDDVENIKKYTVNYKQAFENISFVIDYYFEFILEKIGLRICCFCKRPFEDKTENLDNVPICYECHNRKGE